jgi:cysteine desulfurase
MKGGKCPSPWSRGLQHRYLDSNATCAVTEAALAAMLQASREAFGNPSSLHWAGRAARRVLDDARDALAAHVGAEPGAVVFTSGGTEANNLAIFGTLAGQQPGRIVTTAIEHPSVLRPLERFAQRGWELVCVRPGRDGAVTAEAMRAAINGETRMVCMMAANNETGALQPVTQVSQYCRTLHIPVLVDAVQALGKTPLALRDWDADFVSLSAHKIGGPKGVGALVARRGQPLQELAPGGGQERKRRSGTENVPGIAGFAAAIGQVDFAATRTLRDAFEQQLLTMFPEAHVFASSAPRLPNTSMVHLPGMDGETLLMQLDLAGFAVASGSACSSGKREPSHVLLAMGATVEEARSSLRISFGPGNAMEDVQALLEAIESAHGRLQAMAGMRRTA